MIPWEVVNGLSLSLSLMKMVNRKMGFSLSKYNEEKEHEEDEEKEIKNESRGK